MYVSVGFGAINFTFALVALWTIDILGRRPLLLCTYPVMGACLIWTGVSYMLKDAAVKLSCSMASIFVFTAVYSVGPGPVTFVYAAEVFPLEIRSFAMASSTSVTWLLNFVVSFSWPKLEEAWETEGAFFWYASFNLLGFVFTYFLLPETKGVALEDMDEVFRVRNRDHMTYQGGKLDNGCRRLTCRPRKDVLPLYIDTDLAGGDDSPGMVTPPEKRV